MNNKIEILEKAYGALRRDQFEFNWGMHHRCNIGTLLLTKTELTPVALDARLSKEFTDAGYRPSQNGDTWTNRIKQTCSITGEPMVKILSELSESGFTMQELMDFEYLSGKEVLARINRNRIFWDKRLAYRKIESTLIYLAAWIELEKEKEIISEKDEPIISEANRILNGQHHSLHRKV